jgi:hypothetical protein
MAKIGRPWQEGVTQEVAWPVYANETDVLAMLDTNVSTVARFRESKCDMMDRLLLNGPVLLPPHQPQ